MQHRLHLHALEDDDRRAGLDLVADPTGIATTSAGAGERSDAALVAGDPVRDAVDLDEVDRAVGAR